jgi:hypothetical protein
MPVHRDGAGGAESRVATFTSSSNTSGQTAVVTELTDEQEFLVESVHIEIDGAAGSDVSVQVFAGASAVAPADDPLQLSGELVHLEAHERLGNGDTLRVLHTNNSATDRNVTVIASGVTP